MIESHCHIEKPNCLADGQDHLFKDYNGLLTFEGVSQEKWVFLTQEIVHFGHQLL